MKREFESTEAKITVETDDFNQFVIYAEHYQKNYSTSPKKRIGDFKSEDIKGMINSERLISDFIGSKLNITNVYSLNDFH